MAEVVKNIFSGVNFSFMVSMVWNVMLIHFYLAFGLYYEY